MTVVVVTSVFQFNLLCVVTASEVTNQVLAQAGSTGGSIGKHEKSLQGSQDRGRPEPHNNAGRTSAGKTRQAVGGISGTWNWQAKCSENIYQGVFEIDALADGQFSGRFLSDVPGQISNGRLSGNSFSFLRQIVIVQQPWRGSLSGGQMSGKISGPLGDACTFTATR